MSSRDMTLKFLQKVIGKRKAPRKLDTSAKLSLAVVTMVYNEPEYIPIWLKYYGRQVGITNCFVIDHGSDDGSVDNLNGVNVTKLPRTPKDNDLIAVLVSEFCSSLLTKYKSVIYVDVDEIVVADPEIYSGLTEYSELNSHPAVHAVGFEVQHVPGEEASIDLNSPITRQRSWARLWGGECKSVLAREPIKWSPGFHDSDKKVVFDALFLFHLRYFDISQGLNRLARTRSQPWANPNAGKHQRWDDETWSRVFHGFAQYPRRTDVVFSTSEGPILEKCEEMVASTKVPRKHYTMDLSIYVHQLWKIPEKFMDIF